MNAAAMAVVGRVLAMEAKARGLDEMTGSSDVLLDFQWWRQTARCSGYLGRLVNWEERTGRVVIPSKLKGEEEQYLLVPPDNPLLSITYTYPPPPQPKSTRRGGVKRPITETGKGLRQHKQRFGSQADEGQGRNADEAAVPHSEENDGRCLKADVICLQEI